MPKDNAKIIENLKREIENGKLRVEALERLVAEYTQRLKHEKKLLAMDEHDLEEELNKQTTA